MFLNFWSFLCTVKFGNRCQNLYLQMCRIHLTWEQLYLSASFIANLPTLRVSVLGLQILGTRERKPSHKMTNLAITYKRPKISFQWLSSCKWIKMDLSCDLARMFRPKNPTSDTKSGVSPNLSTSPAFMCQKKESSMSKLLWRLNSSESFSFWLSNLTAGSWNYSKHKILNSG